MLPIIERDLVDLSRTVSRGVRVVMMVVLLLIVSVGVLVLS